MSVIKNNELVKYGNKMNDVPFKNFNKRDLNIYFAIVSRMRDKGEKVVTLSFKTIRRLSGIKYGHHMTRFYHDLVDTYTKMQTLALQHEDSNTIIRWILFPTFNIYKKQQKCVIQVNHNLINVLNNLTKNFTRFNLAEFSQLNSSYSKNMFRLIKQFRTTGQLNLPMKKFRERMCVPKSYTSTNINLRIIKPALIELAPFIKGIHVEKVHHGPGGKITGYIIKFHKEKRTQDDFHKSDATMSWLFNNINTNKYFTKAMKEKARKKLLKTPWFYNNRKLSMDDFNKLLAHQIRKHGRIKGPQIILESRNHHYLRLTEYQSRKVNKALTKAKNKQKRQKKEISKISNKK